MKVVFVFLVSVVIAVEAANREKLKITPPGISIVDWNEYMGKWYMYAYRHSCQSTGAVKFTDWVAVYSIGDKYPNFGIFTRWRKGGSSCSNNAVTCTVTSRGCYIMEDHFGDLLTGNVVIVDTDKHYQHYAIRWCCVKYLGDTCADYWVNVKTRNPHPGKHVLAEINRKLAKLWDTSLGEMEMVLHTNECEVQAPPTKPASRWSLY